MKLFYLLTILDCVIITFCSTITKTYEPNWHSLDQRPLPKWFADAKIGILVHWGIYSVPSYKTELFWKQWAIDKDIDKLIKQNFPLGFSYRDFAPMFQAEFFKPHFWAKLFAQAGAKYVVLTSKHHEGYTLFPSERSSGWNSVDVGPKRDLVHDVAKAVRAVGLRFGLYYSLFEWYHPVYLQDKAKKFKSQDYPFFKLLPELTQIAMNYKPSIIWSDGDWEASDTYWKSKDFLAWLYNDSPIKNEVVVNDRWGSGNYCHHGDFYTGPDSQQLEIRGDHKWENAISLDKKSWGYRRDMQISDVMTYSELLQEVVSTVSCGGNALINIGATKEGVIAPVFQERLISLGGWLKQHGEAIYGTSPWMYQEDTITRNSNIWYTCVTGYYDASAPNLQPTQLLDNNVSAIYAIMLTKKIESNIVKLKDIAGLLSSGDYGIQLLGEPQYLRWTIVSKVALINLPHSFPNNPVLKITRNRNNNNNNSVLTDFVGGMV